MKKLMYMLLALGLVFSITAGYFGQVVLASQEVHWTYSGKAGPEHWGELSHEYAACSEGKEQSPIDIPSTAPVNPFGILFKYLPSKLNIGNNGHTIKVDYDKGSSIEAEGKTYELIQFHFHALSEHTINGQSSDMEVHFVHQSTDGKLAVVGALMRPGPENAAYAPIMAHLPAHEGKPETIAGVTINADNLLPADRAYYRYNGSLTTPPCTEGVKWLLMHDPIELSSNQIAAYTAIYPNNYRPVQPFNDRTFFVGRGVAAGMPRTGVGNNVNSALLAATFGMLALVCLVNGLVLLRREA